MNDLFDPLRYPNGPGARRGVPTSQAAAVSMRLHISKQHRAILDFLKLQGERGGIYTELADGTGLKHASICGRMAELVHAGLVKVERYRTRPTPSGRQAKVYLFVEETGR